MKRLRALALTGHVTASAGWLGAVAAFLALAVGGLTGQGAYPAMAAITTYVIVPLCWATLATGILQALISPWGLIRHYWVLIKLVLTLLATLVLLQQLPAIAALGQAGAGAPQARLSMALHATGGLLVLLGALVLSVFKPKGRTPFTPGAARAPAARARRLRPSARSVPRG